MSTQRPNPDELLARVQAEEARQARGKLKIFFGATAGVGKTYAMLKAAHERRAEGVDVVVGWVDTHGRAETAALLEGLEALPRRPVAYQGSGRRIGSAKGRQDCGVIQSSRTAACHRCCGCRIAR